MDTRIEREVRVTAGPVSLIGDLVRPEVADGLVLFAHGSGSSRLSPRNRHVAAVLRQGGLATVLMDLLTRDEETVDARTAHLRFDIAFLARRLAAATDWVQTKAETAGLPLGYFGASTGAAAALTAAANSPIPISAIVSRGGRPDLAADALRRVTAPTLLLVGSRDPVVLDLNRAALALLAGPKQLVVVPRAGHLFEEPGTLEVVAERAAEWFVRYLELERRWRAADERSGAAPAPR
jgi:alpha-beta hydrolase superfamily lysophospholipase